jgi:hypothetical protein
MTATKFKLFVFYVGFRLVQYYLRFHFHDCEWFLLVFCITLLCSHKRTEFGKPHAYRGPVCASGNCQWCGEPYFVGAVISVDRFLPQIPRRFPYSRRRSHFTTVSQYVFVSSILVGLKSKSMSHYNWRSVSHYIKVSSPFWDLRPDITFCPKVCFLKFAVLSFFRRPLWREVGSVICLSLNSHFATLYIMGRNHFEATVY